MSRRSMISLTVIVPQLHSVTLRIYGNIPRSILISPNNDTDQPADGNAKSLSKNELKNKLFVKLYQQESNNKLKTQISCD